MRTLFAALSLVFILPLASCDEKSPPAQRTTPDNPSTIYGKSAKTARDLREKVGNMERQVGSQADGLTGQGKTVEVAGILFPLASTWQSVPASGMRAAEFKVLTTEGECSCVFFTGIGGSAQSNIARWQQQISPDPGGDPKVSTDTIDNVHITTVSMVGTYTGMSPSGAKTKPEPNTRFLGAIIEGPKGPIQVRLTGPAEAVDAAEPAWKNMIFGLRLK